MGKWVVLGVSIGKEMKVENHFRRNNYACVDRVWLPRYTKNGSKELVVTGYVFVRVRAAFFSPDKLERVPYSNGLVRDFGNYLVNDDEVRAFQESIKNSEMGYVDCGVTFKRGDEVRVHGRLFNNLWGKVIRVDRKRGRCKVGIRTSHGPLRVELLLRDLILVKETT